MSAQEPDPEHRRVPIVWVGLDDLPVAFVNAFVSQFQPGEFILSMGQIVPPPLTGSPEERNAQLESVDFVPIKAVARIGLTRQRMVELIAALQQNLANHDEATGEQG